MTVTLEYLRSRATELDKSERLLQQQASEFFKGCAVRVTKSFWNGQPAGGRSAPNLSGKTFNVEGALFWQGALWLQVRVGGDVRSVQLDHVEVLREREHAD